MKKSDLNSFNDLQMEIMRLEASLEEQERNLKFKFHDALQRVKPLSMLSDLLTGTIQNTLQNRWFNLIDLGLNIYENYVKKKSEGSDKPLVDAVLEVFNPKSND